MVVVVVVVYLGKGVITLRQRGNKLLGAGFLDLEMTRLTAVHVETLEQFLLPLRRRAEEGKYL